LGSCYLSFAIHSNSLHEPTHHSYTSLNTFVAKELALQIYSNNPHEDIDFLSVLKRAIEIYREKTTEFSAIAQWMKDLGLEGFTQGTATQKTAQLPSGYERKIGRNERCPCGSGIKYKRCCGKLH
jgi:preprotein translocase subunit SecA